MTGTDPSLVGRERESSRLRELLAPPYAESRILLFLGDPGVGKTVLLAEATREARSTGMRVLAAAGRESEQDLAFAGLHQLLRPVLDRLAGLPARQADALRGAFALSEDPAPPDALLTGIAVLTLLSALSDDEPLLVAADDAQWLDRASLDALAFAARRLESEQLVLLLGARGSVPPPGFERDFPQADRAVEGDRRGPRRGARVGRRAAPADRPADRDHDRAVRRPAHADPSRAAARRGRRQPRSDRRSGARAFRRRPRTGGGGGPDHGDGPCHARRPRPGGTAAGPRGRRPRPVRIPRVRALARVDRAPGARLEQLAARARGLLAQPAGAESYFAAPLADSAGATWPFERAQLQLDYGEWLRRQRWINDAKPVLGAALDTFRHLGAAPWARRAETGLRACGVAAQIAPATPDALDELTAQQREIVILAGRGLTNGQIADRLFLSPRTVASHLYRSYPKLGIAGRHQLRDLVNGSTRLRVSWR